MVLKKLSPPQALVPFVFILPAVAVLVVGLIIPVAQALYLSFFDWDMGTPWESAKAIGLDNYVTHAGG